MNPDPTNHAPAKHAPASQAPAAPQPAGAEPTLADATAGQQRRFAHAFALLEQAVARRVFPGAVLAVAQGGQLVAWHAIGRFTYDPDSSPVRRETLWDLASLTKPIATVSMAMLLYQRGQLPLDSPVANLLPHFADQDAGAPGAPHLPQSADVGLSAQDEAVQRAWRQEVTVAMLLTHSSGLPAHRKLYLEASGREAIQAAARCVPLEAPPGARALYSDIGFILLGELLERVAGETLDCFCRRELFSPLNLNMRFTPQVTERADIPPTEHDRTYRHRIIQGEVNDENAWAMGGIAGHAGLFGDALSVARFAECLLRGGPPLFQPQTVELFTTRQPLPPGTSRTLGWDSPSPPSQSGSLFSPRTFGHLGYTGTSLWCDSERHLSVTLLTNRTWPDSSNQAIKQLRPPLHDAILRALD